MRNLKMNILVIVAALLIIDIMVGASFYYSFDARVRDFEWVPSLLIGAVIIIIGWVARRDAKKIEEKREKRDRFFLDMDN